MKSFAKGLSGVVRHGARAFLLGNGSRTAGPERVVPERSRRLSSRKVHSMHPTSKLTRRHFGFQGLALAIWIGVLGSGRASAQDFPSRPVRILVPYAAGGTSDTAARLITE